MWMQFEGCCSRLRRSAAKLKGCGAAHAKQPPPRLLQQQRLRTAAATTRTATTTAALIEADKVPPGPECEVQHTLICNTVAHRIKSNSVGLCIVCIVINASCVSARVYKHDGARRHPTSNNHHSTMPLHLHALHRVTTTTTTTTNHPPTTHRRHHQPPPPQIDRRPSPGSHILSIAPTSNIQLL